jgi:hypothetical protein
MKNVGFLIVLLLFFIACKEDNAIESEISKIDVKVTIERFDLAFANAQPKDLAKLKTDFPFLFSEQINDSIWVDRMADSLQNELANEVKVTFSNFNNEQEAIE